MRGFVLGALIVMLVDPILAMLIMVAGFWPIDATSQPPSAEAKIARLAFDASVSRAAPKLTNPLQSSSETLRAGMKFYQDNCAGCHGDAGKPSGWGTTSFYPRVPQFAKEPPDKPDWQLFWIVKNGIRYSGMGAWGGQASDEKIWEVATFLSHLKALPADVRAEWPIEKQ